jgi:hypothetical protein
LQFLEIACIVIVFAMSLFIVVGSYILGRQKYWNRLWQRLKKPEVRSIKELKALSKKQAESKSENLKEH